jgi:hypothetical protein
MLACVLIATLCCSPTLWAQDTPPGAVDPEVLDQLIEQLGDKLFTVREAAMRRLIEIGQPALARVEAALASEDAEVAARARQIIADIKGERRAEAGRTQQAEGEDDAEQAMPGPFQGRAVIQVMQIGGNGRSIAVTRNDGEEQVDVTEGGKTSRFVKTAAGRFKVTVGDKTQEFADEATFAKEQPEQFKVYKEALNMDAMRLVGIRAARNLGDPNQQPEEIRKLLEALRGNQREMARRLAEQDPTQQPARATATQKQAVGAHGLSGSALPAHLGAHLGLEQGVLVTAVAGRAAKLGLLLHDVVLAVGGQAVTSVAEFDAAIERAIAAGDRKIELKIVRRGQSSQVTGELSE